MKRKVLSVACIMILMIACNQPEQTKAVSDETIKISVSPVEYAAYKTTVRASGLLGTMMEMKLSFKTGGIVREINVREGEQVKRGAVLSSLDLSEIRAQVDQARIGLEKAERDLKRAGNLYRDSVATLEQFQNARSAWELALSQKKIADFNLVHSQIKAPSDGKIQKIVVETNEMIAPGYPAILFASTENDWVVRVPLVDRDVVKLAIGDSARIIMDAFPGIRFRAEVAELAAIADPVTGTYEAGLLILDAMPQFRTGFISRAEIYPADQIRALVIPVGALLEANDNAAFVYTYHEGKIDKRRIRTGPVIHSAIVVTEGLMDGELVVTDGVSYLREDSRVMLNNQPEPSNP